jgi:malonyl-CoA/methylmalonyl-CoA synthetase
VKQYAEGQGCKVNVVPISAKTWSTSTHEPVSIDEMLTIHPSRPSLLLYTSGTTGLPKGVVQLRSYFAHGYGTSSQDLFLTHRPVHWIGGLRSIINLVISGSRQEMIESNEIVIWERLRKGGVTILCCVIPMWCRLMQHYQDVLTTRPKEELEEYLRGARALRIARVGGAAPMPSLLRFWRDTMGVPLEVTYGCTETGGPGMMTDSTCDRELEVSRLMMSRWIAG